MIGDCATTGGVAFEAIDQAGGLGTLIVVVLNEYGMSIAPNVGALSREFAAAAEPEAVACARGRRGRPATLLGGLGARFDRLGPQSKESIRRSGRPGFSGRSLTGPTWGSSTATTCPSRARRCPRRSPAERPVVVHIATVKGKGFTPAEDGGLEGMEKWHAAKPKSIANGAPAAARRRRGAPPAKPPQYTAVFGNALVAEARATSGVVGITAAMNSAPAWTSSRRRCRSATSTSASPSSRRCCSPPASRSQGAKPVAAIYSTFLQRAFDQIVHDVCLQQLNVVFAMDRAGLVGDDGPTHHGAFDIAYLRRRRTSCCGAARRGDT